jgi:hypothetical protein
MANTGTDILIVSHGERQEFFTVRREAQARFNQLRLAGIGVFLLEGKVKIVDRFDPLGR